MVKYLRLLLYFILFIFFPILYANSQAADGVSQSAKITGPTTFYLTNISMERLADLIKKYYPEYVWYKAKVFKGKQLFVRTNQAVSDYKELLDFGKKAGEHRVTLI